MRIALLFNGRPMHTPVPDDMFEEYDTPATIGAIAETLECFGEVEQVEAGRDLPLHLKTGGFDVAFNIAEGRGGRCREAHAAAVCELLDIPFTHSDALTLALTLDKMTARRVVSPDVPVAPARLVADGGPLDLAYPVVVKPNCEGSSKGIRDDSVAMDEAQALLRVNRVQALYGCSALVEQYLPGVEVTVAVIGNGRQARVLGMMEIAPSDSGNAFLYSVEAKRAFRDRVRYFLPPRLPAPTLKQLETLALIAYRLLGCRDIARLDFRLDAEARPHFLECNPLPGLNPETSDLAILSRSVLPYHDLVRGIFIEALRRYGMPCGF